VSQGSTRSPGHDARDMVVIVTGASAGIGEATARLLASMGALPVLAARRADRLDALSRDLDGALAVPTDVRERGQVDRLVALTVERHGRVDGLVNNAGVSLHRRFADLDPEEFREALDLNVVGLVSMIQAVLPIMRRQGSGHIVNISSGTTRMVPVGVGPYAATKMAVNMLSSVARAELAGTGIEVSLVLPSVTASEFGGGMYQLGQSPRPGLIPHSPEYVAQVIVSTLVSGHACIEIPHGPELPLDEVAPI
jgi:NADP-dependent 3-hydroxy acid dehydrogenase YdfG